MEHQWNDVLLFASLLVPIITAVTELIKHSTNLPKNVVPIISFVVGLLVSALAYPFTALTLDLRLWAGGLAGLAATGLFELALNPRPGNTKDE